MSNPVFEAMLRHHHLPMPVYEHRFAPPRKWRFDMAWIREGVALEIEGGVWTRGRHTRGKGYMADLEKYNEAAVRGWIVIRVTPDQLLEDQTFAWLKRAMIP